MRVRRSLFAVLGLVVVMGVTAGLAAAGAVSWGTAIEVPGTATLNVLGQAHTNSVSCGSAGSCAAAGSYLDDAHRLQAFVVSEKGGVWGNAIEVPGTAALNLGGYAELSSVSCASAGNCSAGGFYLDGSGNRQAFVVSETNKVWGHAHKVPGTAALNVGGYAWVTSVSCRSAGNCSAGGYYLDGSNNEQAFVVSQRSGVWGKAIEVPGTAALNVDGRAQVSSVSCGSSGNCVAGGYYLDKSNNEQAFVVNQKNGTWNKAIEVRGTAALNVDGRARVSSVSCHSAGNCSAGGYYADQFLNYQEFVVSETSGVWGKAVEVPGLETLNLGGDARVFSVSCASAGNCSAGGAYSDQSGHRQPFVVSQTNGVWGNAQALTIANYVHASLTTVSCASAGNCAAGGFYTDSSNQGQAFVAAQTNGVWGSAVEVPGTAALNVSSQGIGGVNSVSCASVGKCAIGGYYNDGSDYIQAFVTVP